MTDSVRVHFDVGETLWGTPTGPGTVRLDNVPLLVFGVSMGDVVTVAVDGDDLEFAGVTSRGGHSTYRVMLEDADDPATQERFREIVVLGCLHERATPRFNAIDVPPHVDVFEVYELLERGMEAGAWTFEEGHCGHPVDRGA